MSIRFRYRAVNTQGAAIQGEIEAASDRDALNLLAQQNLTPVEVDAIQSATSVEVARSQAKSGKVKAEDVALALQELGTLIKAGIPLADAVQSLAESHGVSLTGRMFSDVRRRLGGGDPLSTALVAAAPSYKVIFPGYVEPLIKASEATGELGPSLLSASEQMLADVRMREETKSALIYPAILVIVGIAITLYIFMQVVPSFAPILKNAKAKEIPEFAKNVILLGVWLRSNIVWVAAAAGGLVLFLYGLLSQKSVRESLFEWLAHQPVIGPWIISAQVTRWASVFGALIDARVPIVQAMELAQNTLGVPNIRRKLEVARKGLRQGERLAQVLQPAGLLRPTALNLIRVGEASSELGKMLHAVAKLEGEAAAERRKRVLSLIEPAAIVLIGVAVGTIMYALISAMSSITPTNIR
jgi:general secretion pathway protein F